MSKRSSIGSWAYTIGPYADKPIDFDTVCTKLKALGFDGVEVLHRQMRDEMPGYVNGLKRLAFTLGLDLYMLSIHQNFVSPDAAVRKQNIDHTKRCIDLASQLGIPAIRLNSGRWGTVPKFDDLMKVKGNEPPLPGHTNDDAFAWCIDSIQQCLPHAERAEIGRAHV